MKIAFVALPQPEQVTVAPPLPIIYIAALLEQQRHIVRIYDMALSRSVVLSEALRPLRAFRPHIVVIASDHRATTLEAEAALRDCGATIVSLGLALRDVVQGQVGDRMPLEVYESPAHGDEQNVIFSALSGLDDDIDGLPFPARHLLPIEQYPLFTPGGELQTTILVAQHGGAGSLIPRQPALIIAEMQSVAREHGIRHFVFVSPPLTHDLAWFCGLLQLVSDSDVGFGWEGNVRYECLTMDLLQLCRRSGCEVLCFEFDAVEVLASKGARGALSTMVAAAHVLGISVRAHIRLQPPYGAIPALVDMSATFGLDDVCFTVAQVESAFETSSADGVALEEVAEMARSRYRSSRSRQFFIDRFGPQLGPMLWRVGRAGLLGRTWQRYADGSDDAGGMVAGSYGGS